MQTPKRLLWIEMQQGCEKNALIVTKNLFKATVTVLESGSTNTKETKKAS